MKNEDYLFANTAVLAFVGDAAYELRVRAYVAASGRTRADKLHVASVAYVRASAQARAIKAMLDDLSEAERTLVRRARNKRTASRPKNADPADYKWATAFEALIGYYFLSGLTERLEAAVMTAIDLIESGGRHEQG